jgi:hypothetical protein
MGTPTDVRVQQPPGRSEIIEHIMRMVVPVRHEFGQSINVARMLDDSGYAQSVFELVGASRNEQLRKEASFVHGAIFGPRASMAAVTAQAKDQGQVPAAVDSEDTRRARAEVMGKYRTGLR